MTEEERQRREQLELDALSRTLDEASRELEEVQARLQQAQAANDEALRLLLEDRDSQS